MTAPLRTELQGIQADLVMAEGMISILKGSAYSGAQPALIGNSLEILEEFISRRSDRLDALLSEAL